MAILSSDVELQTLTRAAAERRVGLEDTR